MKSERRRDLLKILQSGGASRQDEIVAALKSAGHKVTQATVSRDLREIGALKLRTPTGVAYRLPDDTIGAVDVGARNLQSALDQFVIDIVPAASMVVLRTVPGYSSAVGRAIDLAGVKEVAGTIAGDDTVFVACRSEEDANELSRRWLASGDAKIMEVGA
ncbi:MAG: transcriptional regulator of arginine metabolism [Actinomycetota bacterium]|jgi:transcriptional regulator of arginine metabolism|nr:transcriptional regulator of arginine metabolism [Actinomycetota bacterium]